MVKQSFIALLFASLFLGCGSLQQSKGIEALPAESLKPYGRHLFNDAHQLELISSAVHFGVGFEGTAVQIFATVPGKTGHSYLQYELDGVYQKRLRVDAGRTEPFVIQVPQSGKHSLWIYKATEAHTGPILIEKIIGNNLAALNKPEAPLIEFIGNSITCGAAADPSEVPCNTAEYHDQHNAYMAYGPRVARALKVAFILNSVSGIGIYRNWNSDGPTMPQVYEKIDFQESSTRAWNQTGYTPKVVSIALGTNDFSNGDGIKKRAPFDSASFVQQYIPFVQRVKAKYPDAQVALLSSPMMNGERRTLLQNCLTAVKSYIDALNPSDKKVQLYFFKPMQARGCSGHPSVEDHGIMAEELIPFFKSLL